MINAYESKKLLIIILAAGRGTRMKSDLAKVLHPLCGKLMMSYVVETAKLLDSEDIVVIVGHQAHAVEERFRGQGLIFIEQKHLLGTGHAVLQARKQLAGYDGDVLILCGDVPLLRPSTVRYLLNRHMATKASVTVLTTILSDPTGYGRIVKGPDGEVLRIVEERDAVGEEKKIGEINTGIYCVERKFLFDAIMKVGNDNAQKEYYLTDIVGMAYKDGFKVESVLARDSWEVMGINTRDDLERASRYITGLGDDRLKL